MQRAPLGIAKALAEVSSSFRAAASRGGAKVSHRAPPLHHAHPHPAAPLPTSAASSSHPAGRFIRLITESLFKPIKSSAYVHPKGPYSGQRLPPRPHFTSAGRRPAGAASRFGGGLSPRPIIRANTSQLGLGAARNFSSTQPVFAHLSNVPLALRALGGGVDDRKWRAVRKTVRAEMKTAGQQRKDFTPGLFLSKQDELKHYFGSASAAVASAAEQVAEVEQQQQEVSNRFPIVLIIDVEPELSFAPASPPPTSAADFDPSSWRLLTPSVVSHFATITTSYEAHARSIHSLNNRLIDAGVFDDPTVETELVFWREHDGREKKEVHVTFGPTWDKRDVMSIVGWTRGWARVVDLEEEREVKLRESAEMEGSMSAATTSCYSDTNSNELHQIISSTFILPDPVYSAASDSLELSPPLSPSPSVSCDDTLSWNDRQSAPDVDLMGSYAAEECPWDDAPEQSESPRDGSSSAMSDSYEEGVRTFLVELDRVTPRF